MKRRLRALPSPALVIACVSLAVALSRTAVAAGIVANAAHANKADLAKRALNADKIGGKTPTQVAAASLAAANAAAQQPGPASTAAGLTTIKTTSAGQIGPMNAGSFSISCDGGTKVMGGGYSTDSPMLVLQSYPSNDTTWNVQLVNIDDAAAHNVSLYATCLK
jgi:hypothetical protein